MPLSEPIDRTRLFAGLNTIADVSLMQKELLAKLPLRLVSLSEGADVLREGEAPTDSCLVLSGVMCRYKIVGDGRRQIVSLHLPGDLPDLQGLYLDNADHGLSAMSASRVALIPNEALRRLIAENPSVGVLLAKMIAVDGSILREWIANIGRRDAAQRMAHLICEFFVRMRALGFAEDKIVSLPLTQSELGDATGILAVHVNRVMQLLRGRGLISSRGNHHRVDDWPGLKRMGDFNPAYLHMRASLAQLGLA